MNFTWENSANIPNTPTLFDIYQLYQTRMEPPEDRRNYAIEQQRKNRNCEGMVDVCENTVNRVKTQLIRE